MGRKPSRNKNLPAGMRARHRGKFGTYYYLDTGDLPRKEISLGKDYVLAVQKWAELTSAKPMADLVTFRYAAELKLSLDWGRANLGAQIAALRVVGSRMTPNGVVLERAFEIEFADVEGLISFWSTGYEISVLDPPVISDTTRIPISD